MDPAQTDGGASSALTAGPGKPDDGTFFDFIIGLEEKTSSIPIVGETVTVSTTQQPAEEPKTLTKNVQKQPVDSTVTKDNSDSVLVERTAVKSDQPVNTSLQGDLVIPSQSRNIPDKSLEGGTKSPSRNNEELHSKERPSTSRPTTTTSSGRSAALRSPPGARHRSGRTSSNSPSRYSSVWRNEKYQSSRKERSHSREHPSTSRPTTTTSPGWSAASRSPPGARHRSGHTSSNGPSRYSSFWRNETYQSSRKERSHSRERPSTSRPTTTTSPGWSAASRSPSGARHRSGQTSSNSPSRYSSFWRNEKESRSRSGRRSLSRSRSRSRRRSLSRGRSRSRRRSPSRSRSGSRRRSPSRSRSGSRGRSPYQSRSRSRQRTPSPSRSRSRQRTPSRSRSQTSPPRKWSRCPSPSSRRRPESRFCPQNSHKEHEPSSSCQKDLGFPHSEKGTSGLKHNSAKTSPNTQRGGFRGRGSFSQARGSFSQARGSFSQARGSFNQGAIQSHQSTYQGQERVHGFGFPTSSGQIHSSGYRQMNSDFYSVNQNYSDRGTPVHRGIGRYQRH